MNRSIRWISTLVLATAAVAPAAAQTPVPPRPDTPPSPALPAAPVTPATPAEPVTPGDFAGIEPGAVAPLVDAALAAASAALPRVEALAPLPALVAAELAHADAQLARVPRSLAGLPDVLAGVRAELLRARMELAGAAAELGPGPAPGLAPQLPADVAPHLALAAHDLALSVPRLGGLAAGAPAGAQRAATRPAYAPPAPWARQDPADSLYRAAREALNRGEYERAAGLFHQLVERFPRSAYAADAPYWEAFSRSRVGGEEELRAALAALERQRTRYPNAPSRSDAEVLATRIRGQLAQQGDADAAATVTKAATTTADACADADEDVRAAALNALLQMDADRALPILREVLARRDGCSTSLRRKAVFLVAQKVTPETETLLLDVVREDPSLEVRKQAVFWLSEVSTDRAVDALEQILRDPGDAELAERALFALSQHDSPRAGEILRRYASQQDVPRELRKKAIFWLGQEGSRENAEFLRNLFGRLRDTEVRERILFSLSQMGGEANGRWLLDVATNADQPIELRKKALFWAGQSGASTDALVALYDRMPSRELKEYLIFVYSQRDESATLDKMIEIARGEKDIELRKKAIFWLGQSDDPRAAQLLLEIINHED